MIENVNSLISNDINCYFFHADMSVLTSAKYNKRESSSPTFFSCTYCKMMFLEFQNAYDISEVLKIQGKKNKTQWQQNIIMLVY